MSWFYDSLQILWIASSYKVGKYLQSSGLERISKVIWALFQPLNWIPSAQPAQDPSFLRTENVFFMLYAQSLVQYCTHYYAVAVVWMNEWPLPGDHSTYARTTLSGWELLTFQSKNYIKQSVIINYIQSQKCNLDHSFPTEI